ncbi:N-acetyl sugar amidotransferase [Algoriphagus taiwanensis]
MDKKNEKIGFKGRVCTQGLWDESIPDIQFDEFGISSYAKTFQRMLDYYPRGEKGLQEWLSFVDKMKADGKGKKYDCIVGVSGGTDSSYLLHITKKYGLRVLAVYLDNGWGSDICVKNIKKLVDPLEIDFESYVIDYQEVIDVLKAYLRAEFPWADGPTDHAIKSILYKTAARENLKYIINGHDFRSEGFQPNEWTYTDAKQIRYIANKFCKRSLKSFPTMSIWKFGYYSFLKKIKLVRPFFYLPYTKKEAKDLLKATYGWEDYQGHHYENVFTKFIISYWLVEKFGIDKRKITYSGQVMTGEFSREEAFSIISEKPFTLDSIERDITFVIKKLNMKRDEFDTLMAIPGKSINDYPSYLPLITRFQKVVFPLIKRLLPDKPLMFFQLEDREKTGKGFVSKS